MQFAHFQFDPETDRIGEGALSEVYRAKDLNLGRTVALKILRAHAEIDPQAERRFKREAKHTSSLSHENIATIYEYGEDRGTSFIAMEFLEGQTLDKVIATRSLTFDECMRIALQVTKALELVHNAHILHRDLKPGNILLQPNGKLKLLDFGIARARDESGITQQGVLVGTVLYMSPEQVRGESLDLPSDVFSLGAVLYHITTGALPFPGESFPEVCMAILDGEIKPPADIRHGFPAALQEFLLKCMSKAPEDRFANARDALGALLKVTKNVDGTGRHAQVVLRGTLVLPPMTCSDREADSCTEVAAGVRKDIATSLRRNRGLIVHLSESDQAPDDDPVDFVINTHLDLDGDRGKLRINVRFLEPRGESDRHQGVARETTEEVESTMESIWALQENLVRSAMRVLRKRLSEAPLRADAVENDKTRAARTHVDRGMAVMRKGTTKHLLSASAQFRKALELDRYCAGAHAGLGEIMVRKFLTWDGDPTFLDEARDHAKRAAALDPDYALAHTVMGFAAHLSSRTDDAQREYRIAMQIDSGEWLCHRLLGAIHARQGNYEDAAPLLQRAIDLHPAHIGSYDHLYSIQQRLGRYEMALKCADSGIAAAHEHLRNEPDDMDARAHMALLLARRGSDDAALEAIEEARKLAPRDGGTAFHAACVFALLGDPPAAIEALTLAQDRGYYIASELQSNSDLDILRGLPEFQALL